MMNPAPRSVVNPLRWFPEYLTISRRRIRSQSRLMGSAVLVGNVAGLGAIVFAVACQIFVTLCQKRLLTPFFSALSDMQAESGRWEGKKIFKPTNISRKIGSPED